jgi:hypothetical protein
LFWASRFLQLREQSRNITANQISLQADKFNGMLQGKPIGVSWSRRFCKDYGLRCLTTSGTRATADTNPKSKSSIVPCKVQTSDPPQPPKLTSSLLMLEELIEKGSEDGGSDQLISQLKENRSVLIQEILDMSSSSSSVNDEVSLASNQRITEKTPVFFVPPATGSSSFINQNALFTSAKRFKFKVDGNIVTSEAEGLKTAKLEVQRADGSKFQVLTVLNSSKFVDLEKNDSLDLFGPENFNRMQQFLEKTKNEKEIKTKRRSELKDFEIWDCMDVTNKDLKR